METWKDIPKYEGHYQISNLGNVKSFKSKHFGKMLKQAPTGKRRKYLIVDLNKDGKGKVFRVHQLMAEVFLGGAPTCRKMVIDHIDNDPTNNHIDNLQIISQRANLTKDNRRSSGLIGAIFHKRSKKWLSTIMIDGKSCYLGSYDTPVEANKAYKNKLKSITEL